MVLNLSADEFYSRLETDPVIPTTSQPTPQEMIQAFEKVKQKGAEEILILTISSAMSGTFASAKKAAEKFDIPVRVGDSKSNSMSLGWQVLAARTGLRENGADGEAMLKAAEQARSSMAYMISLDTLDYLHKGGRIGGASHFVGNFVEF